MTIQYAYLTLIADGSGNIDTLLRRLRVYHMYSEYGNATHSQLRKNTDNVQCLNKLTGNFPFLEWSLGK